MSGEVEDLRALPDQITDYGPVRRAYSLEELRGAALSFMQDEMGRPEKDDKAARDEWYERLGVLVCFSVYLFDLRA